MQPEMIKDICHVCRSAPCSVTALTLRPPARASRLLTLKLEAV